MIEKMILKTEMVKSYKNFEKQFYFQIFFLTKILNINKKKFDVEI